jgi:hypothetical protein
MLRTFTAPSSAINLRIEKSNEGENLNELVGIQIPGSGRSPPNTIDIAKQ